MSDSKEIYHRTTILQKIRSFLNSELLGKIKGGIWRAMQHGASWQKININDFVAKFTPNPSKNVDKNKMFFIGSDKKYCITADIGGGYCRLEDYQYFLKTGNHLYLDINGNDVRNYKDENGKQHGRKKGDFNKITHFKILHREEMQK